MTASNISDLTNPSCFTNTIEPHNTNETNASSDVVESLLLLPSTIMITAQEEEQTEPLQRLNPPPISVNNDDSDNENHPNQGGRPKGTTVVFLREKQLKYKALVDSVATEWNQVKQQYKYKRVPKNMLDGLIEKKVQDSGLNVTISKNAIRKRVQKADLQSIILVHHPQWLILKSILPPS